MKRFKLNKHICLAAIALVLLASLCIENAMAYFTTYATAKGSVPMNLEFTETIPNDDVRELKKTVSVTNNEEYPCFVRLKIFMGAEIAKLIDATDYTLGAGWSKSGEYYNYNEVLDPGTGTTPFIIDLANVLGKTSKELKLDEFNIIIIQECAPVLYDATTGEAYADWDGSDYTIYND